MLISSNAQHLSHKDPTIQYIYIYIFKGPMYMNITMHYNLCSLYIRSTQKFDFNTLFVHSCISQGSKVKHVETTEDTDWLGY